MTFGTMNDSGDSDAPKGEIKIKEEEDEEGVDDVELGEGDRDTEFPAGHLQPEIILEEKTAWDHDAGFTSVFFTCCHCGKEFEKEDILSAHIAEEHSKKSDINEDQGEKSVASNNEIVEPPNHEIYECNLCDYKTHMRHNLKLHTIGYHTKDKLFRCTSCDYETARSSNLKRHVFTMHTENNKLFHCSECDFKTAHTESLKKHVLGKHLREKPFKCEFCDYRALQRTYLKQHILSMHNSDKPYTCPYCKFRSAKIGSLNYHLAVKHSEYTYQKPADATVEPEKLPT